MKRVLIAAVALGTASPALATPYVCAVVHQVGVVRGNGAAGGMAFPCSMSDDQALYAYSHAQLDGQQGWWWHGFNPSTGEVE